WPTGKVDSRLKAIMENIHKTCVKYGKEDNGYINYLRGANVGGFIKVANAQKAQGGVEYMRALAELAHPGCKISNFGQNQKFLIQDEQGNLAQSFKIAEIDIIGGVNGVFELLDEKFITLVLENFDRMRKDFIAAYDRTN